MSTTTKCTVQIFDKERYSSAYPPGMEDHYWVVARNRLIYQTIVGLGIGKRETILDIGCGTGLTIAYLSGRGFLCAGCDLGDPQNTINSIDMCYYNTQVTDLPEKIRRDIKVALVLDVIEHIHEPAGFLHDIMLTLPNVRYFIITVPAGPELWSNYDEYYGHCIRYTPEGLQNIINASGMHLIKLDTLFHLLYWPARIFALLGLSRKTSLSSPRFRSLHHFFAAILVRDAWRSKKSTRCTSLLAIAERQIDGHPDSLEDGNSATECL